MVELKALNEEPNLPSLSDRTSQVIHELTQQLSIPREYLPSDEEIKYALSNLPRELNRITPGEKPQKQGELIARMCVAISAGLFDSAINYIWNAAMISLQEKVRTFGLSGGAGMLKKSIDEEDPAKLQDSQLIDLCHQLSLVNEDAAFFLDECRDIRNNFSAAHPSIGYLDDRELIAFINRCIKYAIEDSSSPQGIDIKRFANVIKQGRFSSEQFRYWVDCIQGTHNAQRRFLVKTIYGMYCDPNTDEETRLNCIDICHALKAYLDDKIKSELVSIHSEYISKGEQEKCYASRKFFEKLELLEALQYIEIKTPLGMQLTVF